jgi:hypothetical protein
MKSQAWRWIAGATVAFALNGAAFAQNPQACQSVRFSDEVLSRFPKAPQACLDVINRDGQDYAVIKAQLDSVSGNSVRVRFKQPDGTYAPATTIKTNPARRVLVDGKPVPVSELAPNQELTAYVRVDKPMIALPPANESEPLDAVPLPAAEPVVARAEPRMPHTASPLGFAALLGPFLWALAFVIGRVRRKTISPSSGIERFTS